MNNKEKMFDVFLGDIRANLGSYDLFNKFVYLVFLKYSIDNRLFADNEEKFNVLLDLREALTYRRNVMPLIGEYLITTFDNIKNSSFSFSRELYAQYENIFRNNEKVFELLVKFDLKNEEKAIIEYIDKLSLTLGKEGMNTTNESLADLCVKLFEPQENTKCLDLFVGNGVFISKLPQNVHTVGNDINYNSLCIAIIRMILLKKENVYFRCQDAYKCLDEIEYDYVFADGPINQKLPEEVFYSNEHSFRKYMINGGMIDSNIANVIIALENLNKAGKAILTITTGFLTKTVRNYEYLRNYLVNENLIECIIELPPMWAATSIQTNLLVLSKNKKDKYIGFISASNNDHFNFTYKNGNANNLTGEGISKIHEIVSKKIEVENISTFKHILDIRENNDSLVVNRHVVKKQIVNYRNISEIDDEINEVLQQIATINSIK